MVIITNKWLHVQMKGYSLKCLHPRALWSFNTDIQGFSHLRLSLSSHDLILRLLITTSVTCSWNSTAYLNKMTEWLHKLVPLHFTALLSTRLAPFSKAIPPAWPLWTWVCSLMVNTRLLNSNRAKIVFSLSANGTSSPSRPRIVFFVDFLCDTSTRPGVICSTGLRPLFHSKRVSSPFISSKRSAPEMPTVLFATFLYASKVLYLPSLPQGSRSHYKILLHERHRTSERN